MKLNRLYTLVILITIVFSSSVNTFSQDDKILLCEVDMHIGMVWEEVIPVIASKCFYYPNSKIQRFTLCGILPTSKWFWV